MAMIDLHVMALATRYLINSELFASYAIILGGYSYNQL